MLVFEHSSNPSLGKATEQPNSQPASQPTSQSTHQPPIQCRYNNKPPRLSVFLYFPLGFSAHSGIGAKFSLYLYIHGAFYNAAVCQCLSYPGIRAPPLSPSGRRLHLDFHEFQGKHGPTTNPTLRTMSRADHLHFRARFIAPSIHSFSRNYSSYAGANACGATGFLSQRK